MTKVAVWAVLVAIIGAAVVAFAISRSDDPLWPIAAGMVGLIALGVLIGIYVWDAGFRSTKAARDLKRDDRRA